MPIRGIFHIHLLSPPHKTMAILPPNAATPANSAVAPLERRPGRLVLCFDDTAYPFQTNFSNVLKLVSLLRDDDSQMVYYQVSAHYFPVLNATMCLQPGVGSHSDLGDWSSTFRRIAERVGKILDDAFASYLCDHVISGYEWLVQYYNPGDKVYVFGSSALHDRDGRRHLTYWVSSQGSLVEHTPLECLQQCYTRYCILRYLSYSLSVSDTNLIGHIGRSGFA